MRITLEQCTSIYIGNLQKTIRRLIKRDYPDANQEEVFDHTKEELDNFSVNGQKLSYIFMKNRLGGYRWFFACPSCKKRVSKLFLPPDNLGFEFLYKCKDCHGLKNQSMVMGRTKAYLNVVKPLKRMKEIERKIERGYLNSTKIQELLDEYDVLEKDLKKSPDYRVYLFKKRHGISILN